MPESWLRRQAIQIAAQLPEDPNDALEVLRLTTSLVESFLRAPAQARALDRSEAVIAFPAASNSR
jgi:hypothetical protein